MVSVMQFVLAALSIGDVWMFAFGLLQSEPMDRHLYDCLESETKNISVSDYPAAGIMHSCVQSFLIFTADQRMHHNVSGEFLATIRSLVRKIASQRHKRQTQTRRIRREIRRLSDAERRRLFAAINVLKNNGMYDNFATLHQGIESLRSAHNGPNFLGWHRIYLLALEEALRRVDPSVTIPYWDSTIDFDMDDPIRSVLWTSQFFGNGNGIVSTGPFRFWRTRDNTFLTRNIGSSGASLMQKGLVNNIINPNNNIIFHWQIVVWRGQPPRQNILERQHDGVHTWVGGQMRGLSTSPQDPVFFFHHCFVDYVWEQFRIKQMNRGIDPSNDYLPNRALQDRFRHFGNRRMVNFPFFRNIDGYSNRFTRNIYTYERTPECPDCGSIYLFCDFSRGVCVSRDRSFVGENTQNPIGQSGSYPETLGQDALPLGETFESSFFDPRSRGRPLNTRPRVNGPLGMSVGDDGSGRAVNAAMALLRDSGAVDLGQGIGSSFSSSINNGIQNTFAMDGNADVNRWAFMPVRIVHKRPSGVLFNSQIVSNGQLIPNTDFYDPSNYKSLKPYMQSGSPATIPKCNNYGSGAMKVYVEANGVNYAGSYKDYAMVDQRQPIMEGYTYIGIRNPSRGASRAFIHAYDSSGRVCQPRCLEHNTNPPKYVLCSGAITATTDKPSMYADSYGNAVIGRWNMTNNQCPNSINGNVFMTFYCEYNDSWPWKGCPYKKQKLN